MENERGIFGLTVTRMILDKLIYKEEYDTIESNMSDSNIGARKKKNIRNHLFIIYGIINSVVKNEMKPVDIQIYDVAKCFDELWLAECCNNMYDYGLQNDHLVLVYEGNKRCEFIVNTPVGRTESETVTELVMQGSVLGPIQCSVQVDSVGKECQQTGKHLLLYKGLVRVPPLGMGF